MSGVSEALLSAGEAPPEAGPRLRRVLYAVALDASQKFGSLEEQVLLLARAFQRQASLFLPLYLALPDARGLTHYEQSGLPVAALDLRRFRPGVLARLLRLIRAHRIEVIHWNFYPPLTNGYLWSLTCLTPRVRHYLTDHNSRILPLDQSASTLSRLVKRVLLRRYGRVVGVSRFVVECLQKQGIWSNLTCRLHFVNTQRFRPDQSVRAGLRSRLDAGERFVLLTVSNLIREKGVDVLLRALRDLPAEALLWVVGDGGEAERLGALACEAGVSERVRFVGLQREVAPYMQAADCFVCPSLWAEAAGLVCIEAQACGLPVIASNIGGIPEYVADGETGHLFAAGDPAQLTDRVRRLLADPDGRLRMGAQARRRIMEHFSAEARLDDFLDLYRCSGEPALSRRKEETCHRR